MSDLLEAVNALRGIAPAPWRKRVRRVAVILSSSRAGSSLVKNVLAAHPQIASLDGEMEPYLVLSRNGFGANSDSDAVGALANPDALADNIFADLSVPSADFSPPAQLKARWQRRLLLQFPLLFMDDPERRRLSDALDEALAQCEARADGALQRTILAAVFRGQPWRINYYDGQSAFSLKDFGLGPSGCFDESLKIEEPPFVQPRPYRRQFEEADAGTKVLLFKSPSDAYRIGIYEQLFPNADIKYIHLSRGYAQSVNGLMDGWLSPVGFFAHDMARAGIALRIGGYSDATVFGKRWWKFDLPPNWREFAAASLDDVCLNQWLAAHQAILDSAVPALRLAFEQFMAQPAQLITTLCRYLGLPDMTLPARLPVTMATDTPLAGRWRKREQQLLTLGKQKQVGALMERLGYNMDPSTWT
jgi:hypothetical protein